MESSQQGQNGTVLVRFCSRLQRLLFCFSLTPSKVALTYLPQRGPKSHDGPLQATTGAAGLSGQPP